jgi:FMN reductase [NAD(P)H]
MVKKTLFEVIDERRSIRSFQRGPIDDSHLNAIIESCDKAPSAGGLQSFEIYIVKDNDIKKRLAAAAFDQTFILEAPVVLVFCANPSRSKFKYGERSSLYSVQDATIAASYAQLTAQALGLASVWAGAFDENKVSRIFLLPEDLRPVTILSIGYPNEVPSGKVTRGPKQLIHVFEGTK